MHRTDAEMSRLRVSSRPIGQTWPLRIASQHLFNAEEDVELPESQRGLNPVSIRSSDCPHGVM